MFFPHFNCQHHGPQRVFAPVIGQLRFGVWGDQDEVSALLIPLLPEDASALKCNGPLGLRLPLDI